jgi:hypothetical protein
MNDGLNQGSSSSSSSSPSPSLFQSIKISGLRIDNVELSHLDGIHLVVACTLSFHSDSIRTYALIDSSATRMAFVDQEFARYHNISQTLLKIPRHLEVINSRPISSGEITHLATVNMSIQEHSENISMFAARLCHYPVVLGIPWLNLHDVGLRFSSRTVSFDSQYCLNHCAPCVTSKQVITSALPERPIPSIVTGPNTLRVVFTHSGYSSEDSNLRGVVFWYT